MPIAPGTRIGPYEVVAPLGAGGMGEVYLARDPRLGREIALKLLPEAGLTDPERHMRLEREARLLAALNHPNIAVLYGVETSGERLCLAMERVEGESLLERLRRGALPLDEACEIAAQVASALATAHDAGIVHRDLKPGNVMLRADGTAKVLDFGLARGPGSGGPASDLSQSPTITSPATTPGTILGTAAYMSPEQAKGRLADRRSDLWAWGCLLYECLSGRRAFEGEDVSETIAAILRGEPDWSALPREVPPGVRELLRRCLRKDPRERLRDAGDARLLLLEARAHAAAAPAAAPPARHGLAWPWAAALAAIALAALALALLRGPRPRPPVLTSIVAPAGVRMSPTTTDVALSPDARRIVFVGADSSGRARLWTRDLARGEAQPLPGTEGAEMPFWSPDGSRIGFFAGGKLRTLQLATGTLEALCDAPLPRGGAWGRGFIVLQPHSTGPLVRVPEHGGEPVATTVLGPGERAHRFPVMLPDGRSFLYSALPGGEATSPIELGSLDGARPGRHVVEAVNGAAYSQGYLLFAIGSEVRAQRFDPRSGRVSGPAVVVPGLEAVSPAAAGGPCLSVAGDVVVQRAGEDLPEGLTWVDRSGRSLGDLDLPPGLYQHMRFSPDGRRLAYGFELRTSDQEMIWVLDLARGTVQRMTFDGYNTGPVWSPDGRRIVFTHQGGTAQDLWTMQADAPGSQRLAVRMPTVFNTPIDFTPDGREVTVRAQGTETQQDIVLANLADSTHVRPLLATRFNELHGTLSPDGRWLAYLSDESGGLELYACAFPALGSQIRISTAGAYASPTVSHDIGRPCWRRDGRELTYVAADGHTVMAVPVTPGSANPFGTPRPLFRIPAATAEMAAAPGLDRFLLAIVREEESRSAATLLVGWRGLVEGGR